MSERIPSHERVAALGNEIKQLVDLVVEHSESKVDGLIRAAAMAGEAGHLGEVGAEGTSCGWCPICAMVNVTKGERAELSGKMIDQLTHLVAVLRAVLADRWNPGEGVHMPGFQQAAAEPVVADPEWPAAEAAPSDPAAPLGPRVQRIPVVKVAPAAEESVL